MKDLSAYRNLRRLSQSAEADSPIRSETIQFLNESGRRIVGFYDYINNSSPSKGMIILVPAYGKTKTSSLTLAYHLAVNGFQVIRYDNTNHVGASEGTMLFTSLSQIREDLRAAIHFAHKEFGKPRIALVSSSLGVRVALKEAAENERVVLFISLIGVVNLQGTLYAIYREDGVEKSLNGVSLGLRDILGFQIDADHFLKDSIQGKFHTLQTSIHDAARLSIPAVFFVADRDPWVSSDEVRMVFDHLRAEQKEFHWLPGTMHELYENPQAADYACREVVACAEKYLVGKDPKRSAIVTPEPGFLLRRLREEKEGLRSSRSLSREEEKKFWKRYLEKYAYIVNLQDYWNLLDFLNRLLGDSRKGERLLDAGCGIGNLGTFILVHQLYRLMQGRVVSFQRPFSYYVGVDFVDEAIQQAEAAHAGTQNEFKGRMGLAQSGPDIVNFSYCVLDLNLSLPFRYPCFDKICCNFVLSYLFDPLYSLRELFRTLKVGGKIVITSLKPFADLSQIYRDFIKVSRTDEELELARLVLNNAGLIKHKEAEGYYHFLSEVELRGLLLEVGANNVQTFRSFGDQANVAVAQKPAP